MRRIGLIGCGIISGPHLECWGRLNERARVVAVADADPARAQQAANASGATPVSTDTLLADASIEAVDLCLPHHLHREFTERALAAGKHVLCQKPIAHTLADADAMAAAAEAAQRTLLITETSRYDPLVPKVQELVADGAVGDVLMVQVSMSWWQGGEYLATDWRFDEERMGGGALVDGGIHYVDYLLHFAGLPVEVTALTRKVRDAYAAEDLAVVNARHTNGWLSALCVSASSQHTPSTPLRVLGTAGSITAQRGKLVLRREREREELFELPWRGWLEGPMNDFLDCLETGATPLSSASAARDNLAYCHAAYLAAREGRLVRLDELGG